MIASSTRFHLSRDASSEEELYQEEVGLNVVDQQTLKKDQLDTLKEVKVINGLSATPAG